MKLAIGLFIICLNFASADPYHPTIAYDMAYYSKIAYTDAQDIRQWDCTDSCRKVPAVDPQTFFHEEKQTFGFIAYHPQFRSIVVAFRGSDAIENWVTNFRILRTSAFCDGCAVHRGFLFAYNDIQRLVRNKLADMRKKYPDARLMITGHSLGGALASICALDFKANLGIQVHAVYTFGQPRVGDWDFTQFYNSKIPNTFRVVNYADVVPHIPSKILGYYHNGYEIWYDPRGMTNFVQCPSEMRTCSNSLIFRRTKDDHGIINYIKLKAFEHSALSFLFRSVQHEDEAADEEQIAKAQNMSEEELDRLEHEQVKKATGMDLNPSAE